MPPAKRGRKKAGASLPIPNPRRSRRELKQPSEAVPSAEEVGSTPPSAGNFNMVNVTELQRSVTQSVSDAIQVHIQQAVQLELAKLVATKDTASKNIERNRNNTT